MLSFKKVVILQNDIIIENYDLFENCDIILKNNDVIVKHDDFISGVITGEEKITVSKCGS